MKYKAVHVGYTEEYAGPPMERAIEAVNKACEGGFWRLWGFQGACAILETTCDLDLTTVETVEGPPVRN